MLARGRLGFEIAGKRKVRGSFVDGMQMRFGSARVIGARAVQLMRRVRRMSSSTGDRPCASPMPKHSALASSDD
jgi:hypothetical protein